MMNLPLRSHWSQQEGRGWEGEKKNARKGTGEIKSLKKSKKTLLKVLRVDPEFTLWTSSQVILMSLVQETHLKTTGLHNGWILKVTYIHWECFFFLFGQESISQEERKIACYLTTHDPLDSTQTHTPIHMYTSLLKKKIPLYVFLHSPPSLNTSGSFLHITSTKCIARAFV